MQAPGWRIEVGFRIGIHGRMQIPLCLTVLELNFTVDINKNRNNFNNEVRAKR